MDAARDGTMATAAGAADPGAELERLVKTITSLEAVVAGWDQSNALTVQALKSAIEDLNKEALKRLIRALKDDPACAARLRDAVADPIVYGVLRFHGLVREPLNERLQAALDEVRPLMHSHGGDVELVAIKPPDTVEIRLTGACHGCPASSETLREGVEKAVRAHCPEIVHVLQVSRGAPEGAAHDNSNGNGNGVSTIHFISPFAAHARAGWVDVAAVDEIPEGGVTPRTVKECAVLLSRNGGTVSCFDNRCAHLGMPLDMGEVEDGVLTCSYHGFRYLLETGECLTAPEVQLRAHAVRVVGDRVQVRLEA